MVRDSYDVGKQLLEKGYAVISVGNLDTEPLRRDVGGLDSYNCEDDTAHIVNQRLFSDKYGDLGKVAIKKNLDFFKNILGFDLMIQRYPYLRIARPGKTQDNIGLHRDTHYGSSPYEMSVIIPLTNMIDGAEIWVVPGSHTLPESSCPTTEGEPMSEKGSLKHSLGFPYAPKILPDMIKAMAIPIPIVVSQALLLPLATIHGQDVNSATHTRWSIDVRLVNFLAPVNFARTAYPDYYEPLCESVMTKIAKTYTR